MVCEHPLDWVLFLRLLRLQVCVFLCSPKLVLLSPRYTSRANIFIITFTYS